MPAVPTRLALVTAIAAALAALAGAVPAPAAATVRAVACPFPTVGLPGSTTCHRVAVPLDRSAPGSRELEPFVLRTGARHAARPPLVLLAGGPGEGAVASFYDLLRGPVGRALGADRELVIVEQRGTGLTADRLSCEVFSPGLLADGDALERSVARCVRRARARGLDLQHFGTADAALDLRAAREALGVAPWDVYGLSYGTRLAQAAAQADPAGVRRLVLDSVSPLGENSVEQDVRVRIDGLRALARRGGIRDLAARLRALDRRPLALGGEPLTAGTLGFFTINAATYTRATAPRMPAVLRAALRRDVRPFAALLGAAQAGDRLPRALERSAAGDLLGLAVVCGDDAPTADLRPFDADPVGRVLTRLVRTYLRACRPLGVTPRRPTTPLRSDVPALLLAGSIDPVTPPAFARTAARGLPNAQVVEVPGQAHAVLLSAPRREPLRRTLAFLGRS